MRHPPPASVAFVVLGVAALAVAGCGDSPTSPAEIQQTLTERLDTAGIAFHYSAGDQVDSEWQQRFHDWATALLGVQLPGKLQYYKYRNRGQMQEITGHLTNGWADPARNTVHSIWPHDGHEALHVYTAPIGRPSDFFNEGIAVALNTGPDAGAVDPRWNGVHVHAHVAMLRRTGRLVPLATMVTTSSFRDLDDFVSYGEAGSFVLWLEQEYGLEPLLRFFRISGRDDSRQRIEANMGTVWGLTLAEAEQRWLQAVDAWE